MAKKNKSTRFMLLPTSLTLGAAVLLSACAHIPQQNSAIDADNTAEIADSQADFPAVFRKQDKTTVWPQATSSTFPVLSRLSSSSSTSGLAQRNPPPALFDDKIADTENSVDVADSGDDDLWQRVRAGYKLPDVDHPRIESELAWYARHQAYLDRVAERAQPYFHFIVEEVERRGMPAEIALLPIVESAFKPFAYSHGRAAGIWQFIPSTGRLYGLKQNWWYDGRRDVVQSTHAALSFLEDLNRSFKGDWMLALAAYNSGWGTVSRAITKNKRRGLPTDFWSLDLPPETRAYVPKLIAIARLVKNPEQYGMTLQPLPNEPYMAEVDTKKQIDLALAAELAELSVDEIYMLNPGFNRWATDPKGPHRLMLPLDKVEIFEANLAALPDSERVAWERHTIGKGDTLLSVANKYDTTVELIKEINNIKGNMIRQNQELVVPVARKSLASYSMSADQRLSRLQNTTPSSNKHKIAYQVRSGDTWWSISRKHNVNVRTLAKWNGMAPGDTLSAGQKLVIWTKKGSTSPKTAFTPNHEDRTQKITYRVRRGDSLATISRKFNVNLNDLMRWNSVSGKKHLKPGQNLVVYVDVTSQANI
ncbi:MAG: LysM peptidoglycan-binding domain-containing protein [Gammaproteobacteria bacterium]|nr:LysM peptidoglycan-binding domain-containing protein [Gammaproteobacteria bacterium]